MYSGRYNYRNLCTNERSTLLTESGHHSCGLLKTFQFFAPLVDTEKLALAPSILVKPFDEPIFVVGSPRPHIVAFFCPEKWRWPEGILYRLIIVLNFGQTQLINLAGRRRKANILTIN